MGDSLRLLSRVTQAFVDRAPIDWTAVLSRLRTETDRTLFENMRLLDSIRHTSAPASVLGRDLRSRLGLAVAVVGAIQTVVSLLAIGVASAHGEAPADRIPQIILACGFSAASLVLGFTTPGDPRTLFLLAWFVSGASAFARHALSGLPTSTAAVDIVVRGIAPEAFMPACLWEFSRLFPRVLRFTRFDLVARHATTAAWLLGFTLFTVSLGGTYQAIDKDQLAFLVLGHPSSGFWRLILLALVPVMCVMLVRARRAPLLERHKVARLASAITLGAAPILLLGITVSLLPAANHWLVTTRPADRFWLDLTVIAGMAATPLLSTLAVIVDRPFEFHTVLGRPAAYALARGLITTAALTPFVVLSIQLYQQRHASIADVFSSVWVVPLILCAATGSVLLATRSRMLKALDRRLSRRAVEHHQQLARALDRVRLARGPREVVGVLQQELRRGTGTDTVRLLLPGGVGGFADSSQTMTPLPFDSSLIAILGETTAPVDVSADGELHALLPSYDRAWVTTCDVALVAALKHRDETIAAVVVFGPKPGRLPFDESDHWLIATLTSAAGAAWADGYASEGDGTLRESHACEGEAAFECPRCGVVSDAATLPCECQASAVLAALPAHLGNTFVIHRRLGAGGMGIVYLARDIPLDRDVALKTLPELAPGAVTRLRDEARAMAALNHETLATIYGLELWRRTPVLVMEYLPKGTLAHRLGHGPWSPLETIDLGVRLARALSSMHAEGLLHRDLKPSNIGFTAAGAAKLLDFGLAVLMEPASLSQRGANSRAARPAGTAAYLPPEAYRGATAAPAFDLWALSVVLLETVCGANPFAGAGRASTMSRVTTMDGIALSPALRASHADLCAFFERALDRQPEQRFQSASQMLSALEALSRS